MKSRIFLAAVAFVLAPMFSLAAQNSAFCRGFEEGYKSVKGDLVIVPICPIEPITPIGSTAFREGLKAGTNKGNAAGGRAAAGGGDDRRKGPGFCDGFSEGYKSVKGDMVIVPICPIEPITPIGSTAFREGIKAGMKKAGG